MKLFIQIPCYNEEKTLKATLATIPKKIQGIETIQIVVINDGSTDNTVQIAKDAGVDHIVNLPFNRGLAQAFKAGVNYSLQHGADIIVNTDGDNQYPSHYISDLVAPIVNREAEFVIADRQIHQNPYYSQTKRFLHSIGTRFIRFVSRLKINDPVSGMRAFTSEVARELTFVSEFSYTIEMLIQVGNKRFVTSEVPIEVNKPERKSRLFRSVSDFMIQSSKVLIRSLILYRPLSIFLPLSFLFCLGGSGAIMRFLWCFFHGMGSGKVQSLILGSTLVTIGIMVFFFGILADMVCSLKTQLDQMQKPLVTPADKSTDKEE